MKKNKLLKYFTYLLAIILIISLSIFNLYISIYYNSPTSQLTYNIKPYYFLSVIGILVIIEYVCVYKFFNNNK